MTRPRRAARGPGAAVLRVPDPPDRFVGRRAEIDALAARIAAGARVLTLLGPPGTGKTRLSIALARECVARGVVAGATFVDLSAAGTLDDVVREVAGALGVRLAGSVDAATGAARIGDALAARRRVLLVLDNFEQLAAHAASSVAPWSARASELAIVVTSREVLRVRGEEVIEIAPLGVPEEHAEGDAIASADAVALLLARAPGYVPQGEDELAAVAAIARRLEGIPLALELAASRLALMGALELRDRLAEGSLERGRASRLDVLAHGRRDAPARQATLRGALDWSWELLDDEERRALGCLALHRGTFSVDAAVATIARDAEGARDALEQVQSLREKSLVARAAQGRLRLLESVREYALEKLDDPDAALRMARHFGREGSRRLGELRGRQARAALTWLATEREGMLAAHDAIADREDTESIALRVDLLLAVDAVIARLGPGGAHLGRLDAVIASPAIASDPARTTRALVARARVRRDRGEMDACVRDLEEARDRLSGAERGAVRVELGEAWLAQGRFDDAIAELELALSEAEHDRDRRAEQRAHAALGLVHHGRGLLDAAQEHYAHALDLAITLGDTHAEAQARRDLGNLCLMRGQHDRARAHYEEALARSPGDDLRLEGLVRGNLAILDQEQGRLDDAHAHLERALACLRTVGDRPFEAHLLGYLGAVHHERGQLVAARAAYSRALEVLAEVRDVRLEGVFLAARAAALASSGRAGQAQNDLELAERRLREVGDPALLATLELHRAQVAIAVAGDRATGDGAVARARAAIEAAEEHAAHSDDVRFAMRMLRRALPADALEIAESAAWFRVPGREIVDLGSRPTIARVLDALAEARLRTPGEPVGIDALVAAGWPGEKVMPLAAQNRVRVAVTTLRNLGLRGVVVFREGGHLLDASVPLRRVSS